MKGGRRRGSRGERWNGQSGRTWLPARFDSTGEKGRPSWLHRLRGSENFGGQGGAKTSLGRSPRPTLAFHSATFSGLSHASYSRTTRSAASGRRGLPGAGILASRAFTPP